MKISHLFSLFFFHSLYAATQLIVNVAGDANPTGTSIGTTGDLRTVLNYANSTVGVSYDIIFELPAGSETIALNGQLPLMGINQGTTALSINGNNSGGSGVSITIDGQSTYRGLFISEGTVVLSNLTVTNAIARGGTGGRAGGGGMGAGGGLFIDQADVTISNATFSNCQAIGGNGGNGISQTNILGGGGGMGGNGGSSIFNGGNGCGGGGGIGGNGGNASSTSGQDGGGGGGGIAPGGQGGTGGVGSSGTQGGAIGLQSGGAANTGGSGGLYGGGGGGAITGTAGGGGGISGGAGTSSTGGNGGYGGGGGGAGYSGSGGTGNFGGGGGGGGQFSAGGDGGFGGGGGGGNTQGKGNGGFGGGGGGSYGVSHFGTGGIGAGDGGGGNGGGVGTGGGGGGAGLGGTIFVVNGGSLTIGDGVSISSSSVTAGTGGSGILGGDPGTNGAASSGLFFESSTNGMTITFSVSTGTTTLSSSIGDDSANTLPGGTYTAGTGVGAAVVKTGAGTLVLQGTNTYAGGTQISAGTLSISSLASLGSGNIQINGGTLLLTGTGSTASGATINSGTFNMNSNAATLDSLVFNAGALSQGTAALTLSNATTALTMRDTTISGDLVFTGGGSIVFDNTNNNQATISGNINLSTHTVTFNVPEGTASIDMEISGVISNGAVTKTGLGTLTLNGANSYTGDTSVNAGTLSIMTPGSLNSNISVNDTATLRGNGTIQQGVTILNGGTIWPGNSIGTLTIGGDLFLNPDSTTKIDINPEGQSSLIAVSGSAHLDGTLQIVAAQGEYSANTSYTILTAQSGFGGTQFPESKIIRPNFLPSIQVVYSSQAVKLVFPSTQGSGISLLGLSGNSLIVADYLNNLGVNILGTPFITLSNLPSNERNAALETISPSRNSFTTFVSQNIAFTFSNLLSSRMDDYRLFKTASHLPLEEPVLLAQNKEELPPHSKTVKPWNIWLTGFGEISHQDAQEQNPAFNATSGGLFLAADYGNYEKGLVGAGVGYDHSAIKDENQFGDSDINAGYGVVYGTVFTSRFFLESAVWGSCLGIENNRHVFFSGFDKNATSSHVGYQINPHIGMGYIINNDKRGVEPFAAFDWVFNFENSFEEKGAGPFNMKEPSRFSSMIRTEIGLNGYAKREFETCLFIIRGKISYIYKHPIHTGRVNAAIVGTSGSFTVESFTQDQNIASPSFEVCWKTNSGYFISLLYDGEFSSGYMMNEAIGKIGLNF